MDLQVARHPDPEAPPAASRGANAPDRASRARALSQRRRWIFVFVVAVLISLPALTVGFFHDDILQRLMLQERIPNYDGSALQLYEFTRPGVAAPDLVERGYLPWFSHPELALRFFRPLASALLTFDHAVFGESALAAHLHSLAWFLALTAFAASLYRRWFEHRAAWLAALVFALAGLHGMTTAWLAARHSLVAATLGAGALLAQIRFREDGWRFGRALALLGLAASLCTSESGLGSVVFLTLYELTRGVSTPRRMRGAAPFIGAGCGYLVAYVLLDYGTKNSGAYISPFDAPVAYLGAVLVRVPILAAELLGGVPSLLAVNRKGELALAAIGVLVTGIFLLIYRAFGTDTSTERRRRVLYLASAAAVTLVPTVGTILGGRLLPLAMVGAAAVVGNGIDILMAGSRSAQGRQRVGAKVALGALLLLHFGISPLVRLVLPLEFARISKLEQSIAEQADLGACERGGYLYLLSGADPTLSLYADWAIQFFTPNKSKASQYRVLSMAPHDLRIVRVTPGAFDIEVLGAPRISNQFESLYRPDDAPLPTGYALRMDELRAVALATESGVFTRARFELPDDGANSVCLLVWREGRLATQPLPDVGKSTTVEYELGPMGF